MPGTLYGPIADKTIETQGGYWLVRVLGKESRQIEKNDREFLKKQAFDKWVASLWEDPNNRIESYLDENMKAWAKEQATPK